MSQPAPVTPSSVDEFIETYVCWREACDAVWSAYEQWMGAPHADRRLAFAAYRAALEREDRAAHAHGDVQRRLAPEQTRPRG